MLAPRDEPARYPLILCLLDTLKDYRKWHEERRSLNSSRKSEENIHWELGRGFEPELGTVGRSSMAKARSVAGHRAYVSIMRSMKVAWLARPMCKVTAKRIMCGPLLLGTWARSISGGFSGRAQRAVAGSTAS